MKTPKSPKLGKPQKNRRFAPKRLGCPSLISCKRSTFSYNLCATGVKMQHAKNQINSLSGVSRVGERVHGWVAWNSHRHFPILGPRTKNQKFSPPTQTCICINCGGAFPRAPRRLDHSETTNREYVVQGSRKSCLHAACGSFSFHLLTLTARGWDPFGRVIFCLKNQNGNLENITAG
jgi:hypothetical protein